MPYKLYNRLGQVVQHIEVPGHEELALQNAKPDFNFSKSRSIGWQPEKSDLQRPIVDLDLLLKPVLQSFRRMDSAIIHELL